MKHPTLFLAAMLPFIGSRNAVAQTPLINGWSHTGTIFPVGDQDTWTFTATNGDNVWLSAGELVDGSILAPGIHVYGPGGISLGATSGSVAAQMNFRANNTGTFSVVVSDFGPGFLGTGDYRLTLGKTGSPLLISPGDEGGVLTNGLIHTGNIPAGDMDIWSFDVAIGDAILITLARADTNSSLYPTLRLYGPDGAFLSSGNGSPAEIYARAADSGPFTLVAVDGGGGYAGTGPYRLNMAKTSGPMTLSTNDEGGPMTGSLVYTGSITLPADLDGWTFNVRSGEPIRLRMDELVTGSALTPFLRLYRPDGALLTSASGGGTAEININIAPTSGNYMVVASDLNHSNTGGYRLTANNLVDGFRLLLPIISGTNINVGALGGPPNTSFTLSTSTNLATPANLWTPLLVSAFDQFGFFTFNTPHNPAEFTRFYRLSVP